MCYDKTREVIFEALKFWPIHNPEQEDLIKKVFLDTQEIVKSISPPHNLVSLHVDIRLFHRRIVDARVRFGQRFQRSILQRFQRSMEENNNCNMVPASDSSIKSLETKRLDDENNRVEICMICLDEYSQGLEVTYMPCSHLFHENCIKKWLKTSHYCPVCRFEMPLC
ncbi:E3 ubiquitin-protein ligase RING1-like [Abeliophyllum distichum]|uniref:RING-type E3 ubiquitin transferase n=1 Tax=Abeliophyllum distichum TaxID=126358 RepID=A0ABD1RDI7_9LAMI